MTGARRAHIREKSVTDEQRSQPPRPAARPTGIFSKHAAAAREGGCARGCKSHPPNWTVHGGTARCLSPREGAMGISSPGREPMGLNEDEPQPMSLVIKENRRRRVPSVWMKADAGSAGNCRALSTPAGSAWQARREGQSQIKRGGLGR